MDGRNVLPLAEIVGRGTRYSGETFVTSGALACNAYTSFIVSPSFSMKMVTGANTGMNPYRFSHFTNVGAWKKAGYPEPDLDMYLSAMKKSDLDPHAVQDLRMPGAAAFQDAVEVGTGKAVSGQSSPKEALDGVASDWTKINSQKGDTKQLAAYRASLNLGATR